MSVDLKRYEALKRRVDEAQREADKAFGALEQLMVRMKEEFGCKTIDEAQERVVLLRKEAKVAEDKFNRLLDDFEGRWKEVLE